MRCIRGRKLKEFLDMIRKTQLSSYAIIKIDKKIILRRWLNLHNFYSFIDSGLFSLQLT